jgi:hypothetical protein
MRRSEEEKLSWFPASIHNVQPHDEPAQPSAARSQIKTYFSAAHWYCEGDLRQQDQIRDLRENLRYICDKIVDTHLKGKPQRIL